MASVTPNSEPPGPPCAAPALPRSVWDRLGGVLRNDARRLMTTGVPHLLSALALTQGLALIRRVLLARLLTAAELGQMTYVMQIADFVVVFADFGICTAVLKYAAERVSTERQRELYCAGLFWGGLSAAVVGVLYLAAVALLPLPLERSLLVFMWMVVPYIPLAAIVRTPLVFMQARKEIKRAARYTALTQALSLLALVGATYFFQLWGFFTVVTVAPASNLLLLLWATRTELRWYAPSLTVLKLLGTFGVFSLMANAAGLATAAVTTVLLRHLTGSDEAVGVFSIAALVMHATRLLPAALMQTAFPHLSGLLHDPGRLRRRVWELCLKQALVMGALVLLWWPVGSAVIRLTFGARYADAFGAATMLLIAGIPFAISAAAAQGLLALGHVRINVLASLILLGLNTLGCFLWIPAYGLLGAAGATAAAQLVASGFSTVMLARVTAGAPATAARPPDGSIPR